MLRRSNAVRLDPVVVTRSVLSSEFVLGVRLENLLNDLSPMCQCDRLSPCFLAMWDVPAASFETQTFPTSLDILNSHLSFLCLRPTQTYTHTLRICPWTSPLRQVSRIRERKLRAHALQKKCHAASMLVTVMSSPFLSFCRLRTFS